MVPIVVRHVGRAGQCARVVYYVGDISGLRLSMRSIVRWNLAALGPVGELCYTRRSEVACCEAAVGGRAALG